MHENKATVNEIPSSIIPSISLKNHETMTTRPQMTKRIPGAYENTPTSSTSFFVRNTSMAGLANEIRERERRTIPIPDNSTNKSQSVENTPMKINSCPSILS